MLGGVFYLAQAHALADGLLELGQVDLPQALEASGLSACTEHCPGIARIFTGAYLGTAEAGDRTPIRGA